MGVFAAVLIAVFVAVGLKSQGHSEPRDDTSLVVAENGAQHSGFIPGTNPTMPGFSRNTPLPQTTKLPDSIRQGKFYIGSNGSYRFNNGRARYDSLIPHYKETYGLPYMPYAVVALPTGWLRLLLTNSGPKGTRLLADATVDDINTLVRGGVKVERVAISEYAKHVAISEEELKRITIAWSGQWITIFENAPVEVEDQVISIPWSQIPPDRLAAIGADSGTERLRIEDGGQRLVSLTYPDVAYVLQ